MVKAVVIAVILVFTYLLMVQMKKEYAAILLIAGCMLLFFLATSQLRVMVGQMKQIASYLSIRNEHMLMIFKITGVAYLSEFASCMCKDAGLSAVASQVELIGKLVILGFSIPVVLSLFEIISQFFTQ